MKTSAELLSGIPLFSELNKRDLSRLAKRVKSHEYLAGRTIIREGEAAHCLYVIVSGSARVIKDMGGVKERNLRNLAQGDYFGEMALLDGGPRSASIIAMADTVVLTLDGSAVLEEIERSPVLAMDMFKTLSLRLRSTEESMLNVLGGILPICSGCRKIRDGQDWQVLETYISTHSEAVFSHSLCPDCLKELYPEIHAKKNK